MVGYLKAANLDIRTAVHADDRSRALGAPQLRGCGAALVIALAEDARLLRGTWTTRNRRHVALVGPARHATARRRAGCTEAHHVTARTDDQRVATRNTRRATWRQREEGMLPSTRKTVAAARIRCVDTAVALVRIAPIGSNVARCGNRRKGKRDEHQSEQRAADASATSIGCIGARHSHFSSIESQRGARATDRTALVGIDAVEGKILQSASIELHRAHDSAIVDGFTSPDTR